MHKKKDVLRPREMKLFRLNKILNGSFDEVFGEKIRASRISRSESHRDQLGYLRQSRHQVSLISMLALLLLLALLLIPLS